uniref:PHD finger protein ALFIN-LIKE n=1 Tax=Aegilops tauschii subsp. strangulata TaxID=200361 RepID=A0A453HG59_AEGTS
MDEKDWLSLVAVHSDAWLLAVAFYFGILRRLEEKKRLFSMINNLPTIYEVVTGTAKKQVKEKHPKSSSKINKSGTKLRRMRTTVEARKKREKNMKRHYVVRVTITMDRMNSGSAVMLVRHGSTVSV